MSFMSCWHAFKRVLRRIVALLLMQPLMTLMAVGETAFDPLCPGEVMVDYYGHSAVLVTALGGERVMFNRRSGHAKADATLLLHDFPLSQPITACLPRPLQHDGKESAFA